MEMGDLMNASLKALLNEQYKLVAELREENKKLKEYNGELIENHKKDIAILCEENKTLTKCNLNLQEWLDNKEKVNKSLREENKKLNIKVASLEGEIKGLNYTIEELHKELDECECSFGFESDEVGYRKREYKRLKKWIKDHCKGYGNLFPEDEMKRQRKKADKKRKKTKEDDELIYEEGLYD